MNRTGAESRAGGVRLRSVRPWVLSFLFWSAFGVLLFLHERVYWMPDAPIWPGIWKDTALYWLPFAPITPPLFAWAERILTLGGLRRVVAVAAAVVSAVGAFILLRVVFETLLARAGLIEWPSAWHGSFVRFAIHSIGSAAPMQAVHSFAVLGVALFVAQRAREQALAAELSNARLLALKSQLQPHFLFNTLHAVGVTARRDGEAAARMIALLGDLLRTSLEERDEQVTTLDHELARLEPYLEIQRTRFRDRLTITVDAAPAVAAARVPSLLLLPLVENAIRHGVERVTGPRIVRITAALSNGDLVVVVEDDGAGLATGTAIREGIGLGHTRRRLAALYGRRASLEVEPRSPSGVRATVRMPFEIEPENVR